jgi:uncharacterized protein YbjQ (UPF0145 family)
MANPKDILVVTTSTVDGYQVNKYLKPVSSHVVAGTNLFNDFLGGITDIFGGRSQTYQKQLASLYSEAIERIRYAAFEIGANAILGLKIDMDEISGKGKSMFMLTAVGTAVFLEKTISDIKILNDSDDTMEIVSLDKINILRNRKNIIEKAHSESLILNDETWVFITENQIGDVFPFLLKKFLLTMLKEQYNPGSTDKFYNQFLSYVEGLPEENKIPLLYDAFINENEQIFMKLSRIIKTLNLVDYNRIMELLKSDNFQIKKYALKIVTYDKLFYNNDDIENLKAIQSFIKDNFNERGNRTTKKQMLSAKEKEIWICQCGKSNDLETNCLGCGHDIYGFKQSEVSVQEAIDEIKNKISFIKECLK